VEAMSLNDRLHHACLEGASLAGTVLT